MRINLPGVSSLALLLVLSSCELLEDMEAPVSPELSESDCQLPSFICATAEYVKNMPKYPGGESQMFKFMADNLEWPEMMKSACIEGTVVVSFTIDHTGKLCSPKIARSLHPEFDAASIQLVQKMPKWIPGTHEGIPVCMEMNLPIRFRLE